MLSVTASKGRAHDKEKERSELCLCLRLKLASNIKKTLVILITGPCSGLNI